MTEEPRIGVFICHCGLNIAGVIDIKELVEYAKTLPNVVYVKDNRYTCADPGQEEIRKAIKEHRLNRVVVAACSPRMHEPTFRRTVSDVNLNPFLFEMANIREFSSWCHPSTPKEATEKAKDLIKMAVAKVRLLQPLQTIEVPVTNKALVIGGGIAGMNAALDLAEMGFKVYLLEKSESIGGHMAQLDKTFPTNDCSMCILSPKLVATGRHPNITILTNTEILGLDGEAGNFEVKLRKRSRYIIEDKCNGCGLCAQKCPIEAVDMYNEGLSERSAIYVDYPQAVPLKYKIDREKCIGCGTCYEVCKAKAVAYDQQDSESTLKVGSIILAPGFEPFDARLKTEYGYGRYPNVVTSIEFERILSASGPYGGLVVRPSDGEIPKKIAFIQCVGSRDYQLGNTYCSAACCMYGIKEAVIAKEHTPTKLEPTIFYMDLRAYGKEFDAYYNRAKEEWGIRFVRSRVAGVTEDPLTGNLLVHYVEDETPKTEEFDMVVLSIGMQPPKNVEKLAKALGIKLNKYKYCETGHFTPLETSKPGIFVCGAFSAPKDIPESVAQASGAAAKAMSIIASERGK
ncbi:MAG: CoB--CoM heterodisulfide reductase iron-sulfur subunit A family protein, partial [Candidatus Bathyarchaeia archaeon]